MNALDKMIAAVSPERAAKRAAARKTLSVINSGYDNYGANTAKRSLRSWHYHGGSAKDDIEDNLDILRQRSRDAYMGIPTATGTIKTLCTNVVGSGLVPTPQIDAEYLGISEEQAEKLEAQITREFSLWADSKGCDADGIDDFWNLQTLAYTSFLMNGDVFAVLQYSNDPHRPYGLQIRLIEADRICSPDLYDRLEPCTVNGYRVYQIVQGVETDANGTVVAYWISNRHPLDKYSKGDMQWQRVEARGKETGRPNLLHILQRERAGQLRGVPLLAPALETLKQMGRYTEAELDAAVVASMVTVMIEKEEASNTAPFGQYPDKPQEGPPDEQAIELSPAAIFDLGPGEKANMLDPTHPTTTYNDFMMALITQTGMVSGVPPEEAVKQFSTSYSSSRGSLNEFWRTCGVMRDSYSDQFCQPIYELWFAEAVAKGRINAPGFFSDITTAKAYTSCIWNGPSRTSLDPKKEVEAAILRIDAGISTAEQETAQMTGGSYAANMRQRKNEVKKMQEAIGSETEKRSFPDNKDPDEE